MGFRFPKPPMLSALLPNRHHAIEASAGTGKTFLIERRIADLLLTTATTIDQIAVVTFTEKATTELRRRLRGFLQTLLDCDADAAGADEPHWVIGPAERACLRAALHGYDRATITTIHGFCHRILADTAFHGGRSFEPVQVPDELAFSAAFMTTLREAFAKEPALAPLLRSWLAAGRPVTELRRLLFRCAQLRAPIVPAFEPERLTAVFERIEKQLIHRTATDLGIKGVRKVKAVDDRLDILREAVRSFRHTGTVVSTLAALEDKEFLPYLQKELPAGAEAELISELRAAAVPLASAVAQAFLPVLETRLEQHKQDSGQFDFMDMLKLAWAALDGESGRVVTAELQARYRHVLIDEFQDTDELQWKIFKKLFLGDPAERTLTLVGDPKQAIYAFRGADLPIYQAAIRELSAAGAGIVSLDTNYRSSAALVEVQNRLFAGTPSFFDGGIEHSVIRAGRSLRLEDENGGEAPPVCLLEARPEGGGVDAVRQALLAGISSEVKRLLEDPAARLTLCEGETRRAVGPEDIFVLTRSSQEAEDVARALRRVGVPCALFQQEGLFQSPEATAVRDLLAAIANPNDRALRLRAWQTDFFGVPWAELPRAAGAPDSHPLVALFWDWHRLALRREYETLFASILRSSRLLERLLFVESGQRSLENYLHLFEILEAEILEHRGELTELVATFQGFMDDAEGWDSAERNLQRIETGAAAVQVMTMHKAKGLEAAVVFLTGGFAAHQGGIQVSVVHEGGERRLYVGRMSEPAQALARGESRAEDQRLMYVAVTRASARLYLPDIAPQLLTIKGSYAPLFERLEKIPNPARLLARAAQAASPELAEIEAALKTWKPPPFASEVDMPALQRTRVGIEVTSYSRMKTRVIEIEEDVPEASPVAGGLPSGRASGIFLHAILEEMPLASVREHASFDEWAARPDVLALCQREMRAHDIDAALLPSVQRLVHQSLTVPIRAGNIEIPRLADVERERREVEFLAPVDAPGTWVKGFIDLLFEYDGRLYMLDWKSDVLPDYSAERMSHHVQTHYALQARLYGEALRRATAGRDACAGFIFLFMRGPAAHFLPFEEMP
jgi:exodeoxyribonuclease V beta subunit